VPRARSSPASAWDSDAVHIGDEPIATGVVVVCVYREPAERRPVERFDQVVDVRLDGAEIAVGAGTVAMLAQDRGGVEERAVREGVMHERREPIVLVSGAGEAAVRLLPLALRVRQTERPPEPVVVAGTTVEMEESCPRMTALCVQGVSWRVARRFRSNRWTTGP
jgi:hypothetical protein